MKIYIQTRGKTRDYTFLGGEPKEKWWRKPVYEQGTSFEKPTLIIENNASELRCYISGILSSRRDRVNTPIRYTMVIDGSAAIEGEVKNILLLISSALQAFSSPSSSSLQKVLDNLFDFDIDNYDKTKDIGAIKIIEQINEHPKDKKFINFDKKIKQIIEQKEFNRSSNAVAFLNLVNNKDYINSEIQPALNKSDLNSLSLLESLSSGKMFDDLTNSSKKENTQTVPPSTYKEKEKEKGKEKGNNKKIITITIIITIIILLIMILKTSKNN